MMTMMMKAFHLVLAYLSIQYIRSAHAGRLPFTSVVTSVATNNANSMAPPKVQ